MLCWYQSLEALVFADDRPRKVEMDDAMLALRSAHNPSIHLRLLQCIDWPIVTFATLISRVRDKRLAYRGGDRSVPYFEFWRVYLHAMLRNPLADDQNKKYGIMV